MPPGNQFLTLCSSQVASSILELYFLVSSFGCAPCDHDPHCQNQQRVEGGTVFDDCYAIIPELEIARLLNLVNGMYKHTFKL